MTSALINHLWQSTLFAGGAGLLAFVLRKNRAQARYWIWLIASLKFLVPFSLIVALGSLLAPSATVPAIQPEFSAVVNEVSQPFTVPAVSIPAARSSADPLPTVLFAIWSCGFAIILFRWCAHWLRVRSVIRAARPLSPSSFLWRAHSCVPRRDSSRRLLRSDRIPLLCSSTLLEPGIFGIFRPVLLLPEGIANHLTREQLNAILAHELCHARRRDNLFAALHMLVEAIFWFHPLVWWIGARLVEERERACDEEVLRQGNEPHVYAESILKTCQFYLESPLACMSGVTGSDLKKRIVRIMTERATHPIDFARKALLAAAGALAIAGPLAFGLMNAPQSLAQSPDAATSAAKPKFEVASIKPDKSGDGRMWSRGSHGRFWAHGITVALLIQDAYDLHRFEISGGPHWIDTTRFDIDAKPPESADGNDRNLTPERLEAARKQRMLRLQSLLAQRFQFRFHTATKRMRVYALVVGKNGPKLQESGNGEGKGLMTMRPGELTAHGLSMPLLAANLSNIVGRVVLDKTRLSGDYDFALKWASERIRSNPWNAQSSAQLSASVASGPSIFTALQEQLGLKLVPRKAPVEILVIDRINKVPTPN